MLAGGLILASPMLLFKPKTRAGLKGKMGLLSDDLETKLSVYKNSIWIHAVSVGEFNGAFPFIEAIKNKFPNHPLIVSTTTEAGQVMAKQRAGKIAQIIYFPFDLPWVVDRMLNLISPAAVVIFETELWPNFISSCHERGIPVVLLNARMSPRSFAGYKAIKQLIGPLLNKLTLIGAQTEAEAEHYKLLAGNIAPIKVFGNLKYDRPPNVDGQKRDQLKKDLGIKEKELVLIAGSTHADEERTILDLYQKIKSKITNLKVIIAPRHPERFEEVAAIIKGFGYEAIRYSQSERFKNKNDIYLLDTIGVLADYYALASVAFVGGSLAKIGGHNLLEPYLYGVPVVCGPYLDKTKETATILSDKKALFIGENAQAIQDKIIDLLENETARKQMGKIGQTWLNNNRGAVEKSITAVSAILSSPPQRLATAERAAAVNPWHELKNTAERNAVGKEKRSKK